jgi:alpha-N-arabinofuranosidase
MSFTTDKANEKAGLVIFQNEEHYYYICKSIDGQKRPVVQLYKSGKAGETELLAEQPLTTNLNSKLQLRIRANGASYAFDYATTAGKWTTLKADVDGKFLSTHTAGGFVGCVFALYATSNGKETNSTAKFTRVNYAGNDSVYH